MPDTSVQEQQEEVTLPNQINDRRKSRRRKTAHLKLVPETRELRERIRKRCCEVASKLDKSRPLPKDEMESLSRSLLESLDLPDGFVGWTMVVLTSAFWQEQVAVVPPERRPVIIAALPETRGRLSSRLRRVWAGLRKMWRL